mmetsp:Transcript_9456/g.32723  ORF Transcript_9456/g.32723 Transcript_9456/m.32723 type:complete len:493 (+) Transcript_9456:28-1506(+)
MAVSWARRALARAGLAASRTFATEAKESEIVVEDLARRLSNVCEVSRSADVRKQHATDEGTERGMFPPDLVAFPSSTEDVSKVVEACTDLRVPMIATGALTSLEGHLRHLRGGLAIDVTKMSNILSVCAEDQTARVQAGVTRMQLNEYLRDTGLFFPVDPGADATLGGMAACRASGTNAVKYGTMRDVVGGLTAVLSGGRVVRCGGSGAARKSSTGYDLSALMVGSEGTLGVITELQVRLAGQPGATVAAVCPFETIEGAATCVAEIVQCGVPLARCELLDAVAISAVNEHSGLGLRELPTLFFEFTGSTESAVEGEAELAGSIVADHGGGPFKFSSTAEERSRLWRARHEAYWAALASRPGCRGVVTDVCVPLSKLAESISRAKSLASEVGLRAPTVGHVGDGNYHLLLLVDPANPDEVKAAKRVAMETGAHAIELGGTCSGEHGVGVGKLPLLEREHGRGALEAMVAIKRALDPHGLFNPGKIGSEAMFS